MREKTIRILEYNKILTKLEEQAGSELSLIHISGEPKTPLVHRDSCKRAAGGCGHSDGSGVCRD